MTEDQVSKIIDQAFTKNNFGEKQNLQTTIQVVTLVLLVVVIFLLVWLAK